MKKNVLFFVFYCCFASLLFAQQDSSNIEDELSGFTIDNTITRLGHDFARYIANYRSSNYANSQYNLVIHERPSARWGNLIWITYEYKEVFRQFVHPNIANIKPFAEQIAQQLHNKIEQIKLQEMFADTFDLDAGEI